MGYKLPRLHVDVLSLSFPVGAIEERRATRANDGINYTGGRTEPSGLLGCLTMLPFDLPSYRSAHEDRSLLLG